MQEALHLTLGNDLGELARVNELALSFLERHDLPPETVYATNLALEEILSNVIRHAYEDAARHEIAVSLSVGDGTVDLQVVDDGRAFDPRTFPSPDVGARLEDRPVGGLGIHLLRKMVREIGYERSAGRNHLSLRI